MRKLCRFFSLWTFLFAVATLTAQSQTIFISEFMASNTRTLTDEDGEFSDWIEVHNSGATTVDLLNWSLTDSAGDLQKWRFPATNLPPSGTLLVFASNKNRRVPGQRLHTNFRLADGGEYLALVRPDGTIASQFSPNYPAQLPDVSFGFGRQVQLISLIAPGSTGRMKVPQDESLDVIWTGATYDDSQWLLVTNGIGFETGGGEFHTNVAGDVYEDLPAGFWRLNEAGNPSVAVNTGAIGAGFNGQYKGLVTPGVPGPRPNAFPGFESGNLAARFNGSNSTVDVAYSAALNPAGAFTLECWVRPAQQGIRQCPVSSINYLVNDRSGYLLYQTEGNEWEFRVGNTNGYAGDVRGGIVKAGEWQHVVGVFNGASVFLYLDGILVNTAGLTGLFQPNRTAPFRIGATGSGTGNFFFNGDIDEVAFIGRALTGAEVAQRFEMAIVPPLKYQGLFASDIRLPMHNINSSAYVRLPFALSSVSDIEEVRLRIKYDDGFAGLINGTPVASAGAPETLAWNSRATSRRSTGEATQYEEFDLSGHVAALREGANVLAIQPLNVASADNDLLMVAELEISRSGALLQEPRYFLETTPGEINNAGTKDLGPIISAEGYWPRLPATNNNIVVTCRVDQAFAPLQQLRLHWRVMYGATNQAVMFDDGRHGDGAAGDRVYGAVITNKTGSVWNYTAGQMVRWYFTAVDSQGRTSRWPMFPDPAGSAEYFGTVVQADYVASKIPVVHFFVSNYVNGAGVDNANKTGGRASIYHDGEFYDNVFMKARGNSTAGYLKKSHSVYFNREHQFRHPGPGPRVRKTSWTADYPDPTYMRQRLSFWLAEQVGAPGPFYYPMRLQMNGAFYQLANHNDLHGEEMLERLGYDPDGALYNAAGTIVPSRMSTGGFDKKTRQWEDFSDYTFLANSISEGLSEGQRRTNLFDLLDVPQVINYMVTARFVHENDDVWANMSLYHDNDGDNLWRIIPFDMNLSWGAAFLDDWSYNGIQVTNDALKGFPLYGSSKSIPIAGGGNWNRLYDVIFSVPQTREMFLRRLRTVLDTYVKPPGTPAGQLVIEPMVLSWRDTLLEEAQVDRAKWGWPGIGGQSNFEPGITLADGVNSLINDYIAKRRTHLYVKHSVTNTALPIGIDKSQNAGIPLAQPGNAVVTIAGIDYNPASGNQDHEYICLTNANAFAVDVSGWKLDGGVRHKLQTGTVIPAYGSLYLSPNARSFRARPMVPRGGMGLFVQGNYEGRLNAWGESITLADPVGRLVSSNYFLGNPSLVQRHLRITEIMYNPAPMPGSALDPQLFEYIELKNTSASIGLNLSGVRFTNGIYFNFSSALVRVLNPGETVLLVRNMTAFTARYGSGYKIAGEFAGALDNGGEIIRLEDGVGEKVLEFGYDDGWYPLTDGLGFSLTITDPLLPWQAWGEKGSWRASGGLNGSPGGTDPGPAPLPPVLVNEVLAHTDLPLVDSIELYNPTATNVNVGGWLLTDNLAGTSRYRILENTWIEPGKFLLLNANQFGAGSNSFLLSESGDQAFLLSADSSTNLTGYIHGFEFPASPNGVSFGRYVTSHGREHFVLQSEVTLNATNSTPRVGPIVISEIMYHPPNGTNGADNAIDEFIELQNVTSTNVPLYCTYVNEPGYGNAARTNTWRIRNAVDFDFPTNLVLAARGRLLLVSFSPTNTSLLSSFRSLYSVPETVPIYGPWQGKLDNSGETVELKNPDRPNVTSTNVTVPYITVDRVEYKDGTAWPADADGTGNSLQRVVAAKYGNDPANWVASGTTAGRTNAYNLPPTIALTSPPGGSSYNRSQTIVLSASGSDADGEIAMVEFFAGGTLLGADHEAPWSLTWTNPTYGSHLLTARATDDGGSVMRSPGVLVSVTSAPPIIVLTSPLKDAIYPAGSPVLIGANAQDPDGVITRVEFFANGSPISSVSFPPWSTSWSPSLSGPTSVTAIAHDDSGAMSVSEAIEIAVQATLVNPVVVPAGASWRYLDKGSNLLTAWISPSFADETWPIGNGRFGFNANNNAGIATVVSYGPDPNNKYITYYFRKTFVVPSLQGITNLLVEAIRDDGVAVYLNGTPFYRNGLPAGTLVYNQFAVNAPENGTVFQTEVLSTNGLVVGTNYLAAEIHQSSLTSSDLAFDLRLSLLGGYSGPAFTKQPKDLQAKAGETALFAVEVAGTEPMAYQWQRNGIPVPGGTGAQLSIANVQAADAGQYAVAVSNPAGNIVSRAVQLTVTQPVPVALSVSNNGGPLTLTWSGGQAPFQLQVSTNIYNPEWKDLGSPTDQRQFQITPTAGRSFYRILAQ